MVSAPACVLRFFMIRPHAMATLVRDVAVSVSVCHLHTEQKLHGRRPHLAAACMPSCSPPAPLTHPLAVSCLPSQLCFLSHYSLFLLQFVLAPHHTVGQIYIRQDASGWTCNVLSKHVMNKHMNNTRKPEFKPSKRANTIK